MQKVADLGPPELRRQLGGAGLKLAAGPYVYSLRTDLPQVVDGIETLYADFPLADEDPMVDYNVSVLRGNGLLRWRRQAEFLFDHQRPFAPIPVDQSYAFTEWGLNWCVSLHANEYLKLHAAAVAHEGRVVIMPGVPGAGKSTLCAALGLSGWQVLSDEHALIPPGTSEVVPLYRPVSLKNESIEVIRRFDSSAIIGPISTETHKGTVAHLKADRHLDSHLRQSLQARLMVFPQFSRDKPQNLSPCSKTGSFMLAAYHSFNYSLLCETGFHAMETLVDSVPCYDLVYRDLDWAIRVLGELLRDTPPV